MQPSTVTVPSVRRSASPSVKQMALEVETDPTCGVIIGNRNVSVRGFPGVTGYKRHLKCLSRNRCHHLLKTFWRGYDGWSDRQLPDATIIWTAPSGTTYRTRPGSRLLIPSLSLPTGELPDQHLDNLPTVSGLTMPKRKRTRAQNTLARILSERR